MDSGAQGKINPRRFTGRQVQRERKAMRLLFMILTPRRGRYALTVYDPDAPTGSGWWHWVVYNIPATVTELPVGAGDQTGKLLPPGAVQGRTDFGTHAFGGACPPKGDKPHRYIFTVYSLKIEKIDVPADSTAALIGFMINANSLGKASFTAKYGR
jgi:Raf kinase inhibitor-like YbhB/YbcL family protein